MSSSVPNCSGSGCTSFGANYREGVFCSFHAAELGLQRHSGQCWRCQGLERRVDDRGAPVTVRGVELPRPFSQIENRLPVVGDHVVTLVEWMGWMGNSFALVVAVNLESQTASIHLSCDSVADLKFGQFVICGVAKAAPQAASAAPARPSDSIASHDYFDDRDLQEAIAASMGIGRFGNVVDDEQNSDVQRAIQASLGLGSYLPPSKVEDVHFSAVDPPLKNYVADRLYTLAASGCTVLDSNFTYGAHTLMLPTLQQGSPFEGAVDREALQHLHLYRIINPGNSSNTIAGLRPSDLVPLKSIGNGNCLMNSVSIALWGINDRRRESNELGPLRHMLSAFTQSAEQNPRLWAHFTHQYALFNQNGAPAVLNPREASRDREFSDQSHIFAMANIIRRPIIVFSLLALSDHPTIPVNFAGIYLPFFSLPEETDQTPIFVAYLGGSGPWGSGSNHFVPLVCQRRQQDSPSTRISLQCQEVPLPVLFPSPEWSESEIDARLRQYLSISVGDDGYLCVEMPDPWDVPTRGTDVKIPARLFVQRVAEMAQSLS